VPFCNSQFPHLITVSAVSGFWNTLHLRSTPTSPAGKCAEYSSFQPASLWELFSSVHWPTQRLTSNLPSCMIFPYRCNVMHCKRSFEFSKSGSSWFHYTQRSSSVINVSHSCMMLTHITSLAHQGRTAPHQQPATAAEGVNWLEGAARQRQAKRAQWQIVQQLWRTLSTHWSTAGSEASQGPLTFPEQPGRG